MKPRYYAQAFEGLQNFWRDSPIYLREGIQVSLSFIASNKWKSNFFDIKTTFL